jgi:hypothetical protein
MSDVAWARVERGLMQKLDAEPELPVAVPPRRRWIWIAAPALAVAATIALVVGLRAGPDPVAQTEPSRVVAGDAPSSVSFGDAHLALAARSAIVMTQEAGAPSVLVERGAVVFTVAPRAERPPFVVRAGDVVVRVVGTKFQVARWDERISVGVEHGIVDVIFRGATVRVGAGQQWTSESPEATTTIAMSGASSSTSGTSTAGSSTAGSSSAGSSTATSTPSASAPSASAPAIDPPTPTPTPTAKTATRSADVATSSPTTSPATTSPATTMPTTTSRATDREKYEQLIKLEAKDPKKALAGYLQLSSGNSEWAAIGLYAAGRLAADRNDPRARTFLEIYLRRFPNGANTADAKNLLDRLQGARP